ncbi:hypothetical protein TWF191_006514 [Orbilia oligospora]|uniref:Uncharacterized protein n=2 Tax=Orbilia oligospora TaxID=2813651 RepID=A0A7C8QUE3_ORBOL|nr:hypothetical protein TWF191_006514 [Orbilia oligospora]
MRSAIIILATAAFVSAQSSLIEEYARRSDIWLNPPSNCGRTGCVSTKCGTGQCQFGLTCGTWAGAANTCCEVRHGGKTTQCTEYKDLLGDFNLKSDGDAAILTAAETPCADDQVFILSDQVDRSRSYCCPFGRDGIVSVDYGEFLNNLTIVGVRCIPPIMPPTASGDMPSTTTGGSGSPARTSTGATGSSTPNSANTIRNIFALAPIAFMALAALTQMDLFGTPGYKLRF